MIFIKKINIIKKNEEFSQIINNGKCMRNQFFSIYIVENKLGISRFGISVSKKIGIAVVRNKLKRQIKNIIDINQKVFKKNIDYIIIGKKELLDIDYNRIEQNLIFLIKKDEWRTKYEKK